MIDELEAKRQRRRDIHEGLMSWLKFLREHVPTEKRGAIAAEVVLGLGPEPVQRVLDACADEDLVAFMARIAGAKAFGELAEHIRSVQFIETEAERVARERKEATEKVVQALARMDEHDCGDWCATGRSVAGGEQVHANTCAWVMARKLAGYRK